LLSFIDVSDQPSAQFLLLIDAQNTFQGYLINSSSLLRVQRFEIDVLDSTLDKRPFFHQISLHVMYVAQSFS
jgi:hypothetical protein